MKSELYGNFLLIDRVSVGGMAEVFKAKQVGVEGFQKIVAIKRLLPNVAEDEELAQMFVDEANISGLLHHANIAQIYDLGKVGGSSYFICMEYVQGKDLRAIFDRLKKVRRGVPLNMAAYVCAKSLDGLDYAHHKTDPQGRPLNIVHRDISPPNILVSYEGEVKVVDFGIAKAEKNRSQTQQGILKGKFGYMAPEQVRGQPVDCRADIFAIGILLYEMITGRRLFTGGSDYEILEKVRDAEIRPPTELNPNVPRMLDEIVMRMLQRDPAARYQTAAEARDDLHRYLYTQPVFYTQRDLRDFMRDLFEQTIAEELKRMEEIDRIDVEELHAKAAADQRMESLRAPHLRSAAVAEPPPAEAPPPPLPAAPGLGALPLMVEGPVPLIEEQPTPRLGTPVAAPAPSLAPPNLAASTLAPSLAPPSLAPPAPSLSPPAEAPPPPGLSPAEPRPALRATSVLASLPTDPAELERVLQARAGAAGAGRDAKDFKEFGDWGEGAGTRPAPIELDLTPRHRRGTGGFDVQPSFDGGPDTRRAAAQARETARSVRPPQVVPEIRYHRPKLKYILPAIGGVFLVVALAFWQRSPYARAPIVPAPRGETAEVTFLSNEEGVQIQMDNTDLCVAPCTVPNVPAGTFRFTFSKAGFLSHEVQRRIPPGGSEVIAGGMYPVGKVNGSAIIDSDPRGAEVFLSGSDRPVGTTPLVLDNLPAGVNQTIRLSRPGYHPLIHTFTADADRFTPLPVLRLVASSPVLRVTSEPMGARILINGTPSGFETPRLFLNFGRGTVQRVRLEKEGFEPFEQSVSIEGDGEVMFHHALVPRDSAGTPGRPTAPPRVTPPTGTPGGQGTPPGRPPGRPEPTPTPGAGTPPVAAEAGAEGTLFVRTTPSTEIYVDNRPLHRTTPAQLNLPAGPHTLKLINRDEDIHEVRRVDIRPGETTRVIIDFNE